MNIKLNSGTINSYLNDATILSFLERNIDLLSNTVLDIGCGKMKYKNLILSGKKVREYIGLDLEPGQFDYSVKADIYWDGKTIPFSDSSVDSALILEVLEHCDDPKIVIAEAFRILKPNGVVLFSTPFLYQFHGTPFDYQRFTPYGLKKLFSTTGFSNLKFEAGGMWDASLGQMIGIWITKRPMPILIRKILQKLYVPIFRLLLRIDSKKTVTNWDDGVMIPNILGVAYKKI